MVKKSIFIFMGGFISSMILFYFILFLAPSFTGFSTFESNSPPNHVNWEDIILMNDRIILKIPNATLSNYKDTGSMGPFLNVDANGIRIVPSSEENINVGDIVSYRIGDFLVVHRVVEKGIDSEGGYFILQGDNNLVSDGKVRFSEIEYVTVGVIW
jgi:hypothetical protein|tara:strand:- start:2157 stop:2624 length:468 start_codon:yes stop_codon:yes gene_type:complete